MSNSITRKEVEIRLGNALWIAANTNSKGVCTATWPNALEVEQEAYKRLALAVYDEVLEIMNDLIL